MTVTLKVEAPVTKRSVGAKVQDKEGVEAYFH